MLRPLVLDFLDVLLPLAAGVAALVGGRYLRRLPAGIFRGVIGLSVAIVLFLGVAYFTPLRGPVNDVLWHVGGIANIACVLAMLLLGVVLAVPGRSTSTGFLRVLAGLVALIVVLNSGGRLWWRFVSQATWDNAPDARGCLTQSTGWTCSPAVAAMLLHHHGISTTEGEMAYLANTSYLGTDVQAIAQAMTAKGASQRLVAQIRHADYDSCLQQTGPFLACVTIPGIGGHAVFVLRMSPEEIELIDPRIGQRQKIARAQIEPQWDGKIVYLQVAD